MRSLFLFLVSGIIFLGMVFLPSCSGNVGLPSQPPTFTFTPTETNTVTGLTSTPTPLGTGTNTPTLTSTSTATRTHTPTSTLTGSNTFTFTPTWTLTGSHTPTWTPTGSNTDTFTPTWTLTGSNTPTFTPTPTATLTSTFTVTASGTVTPCLTAAILGDSTAGVTSVYPYGMTQAQQYTLAQSSTVNQITLQLASPATLRVGIYGPYGGNPWPGNLIYVSAPQTLSAGLVSVPVPNITLAAGTYWLAYNSAHLTAASGSTALRAYVSMDFPCNWMACGYTSCSAPTCPAQGPGTPTCTPTPLCTPPPTGVANNEGVIYAGICL